MNCPGHRINFLVGTYKVIALPAATVGSKLIINLDSSTSYTVGTPASASLLITN